METIIPTIVSNLLELTNSLTIALQLFHRCTTTIDEVYRGLSQDDASWHCKFNEIHWSMKWECHKDASVMSSSFVSRCSDVPYVVIIDAD